MPSVATAIRYWETLRHLKPTQIVGRLRFRLQTARPDLALPPPLRKADGFWVPPARRRPSMTGEDEFVFLNSPASLAAVGWDGDPPDKLWRYNQHYFDDLNADGAENRAGWHRNLLEQWVRCNPAAAGTGWEPYPTSLRIVNWIKWALAGQTLPPACIHSLAVQIRWLSKHMEWHLLGNHLFSNAKALVFAGAFFGGDDGGAWLRKGLEVLRDQLGEQFLADGGHFELSPMYHALGLEDLLDLTNLQTIYPAIGVDGIADRLPTLITRGLDWLAAMCHPDGEIAFFNDAAFGIAPTKAELFAYAERLGFDRLVGTSGSMFLQSSGYVRLEAGPAVVLFDVATVGPDYLPGHAHADTLSFELSLGGQRVFVNSGTSEYGTGAERKRQRGTAAHNTVTLAAQNSSDVWAGFRVGQRAYPSAIEFGQEGRSSFAQASHDGYRKVKGGPMTSRKLSLADGNFVVEDDLLSDLPAEARYHLHPLIAVKDLRDDGGTLVLPDGKSLSIETSGGKLRSEGSSWHPEFGLGQPSTCLVLPLQQGSARLRIFWN